MAEVITLNPHDIFNDFTQGTNVFLRKSPKTLINYKQVLGDKPDKAFVLNDQQFASLQLYVKSGIKLPATSELFQAVYPYASLNKWLTTEDDYKQMRLVLVSVHQHCEVFLAQGINPMIGLAHAIVEFSKDTVTYLEALKENMDIICNKSIPPSSEESIEAKEHAIEILDLLKQGGMSASKEVSKIIKAIDTFTSKTDSDASALSNLQKTLDLTFTEKDLENVMIKYMSDMRASLRVLVKAQEMATSTHEYVNGRKYYKKIPGTGSYVFKHMSYDLEDALQKYKDANKQVNETIAQGDHRKMKLLECIDHARELMDKVDSVKNHIKEARESLNNIMNGMGSMLSSCKSLIDKLNNVNGQIKPEAPGSDYMTRLHIDTAVQAWNGVLSSALAFAEYGLIEDADMVDVPKPKIQPTILAAHYAGITVTELAKMQLNWGDRIVIRTNDLEFPVRMEGKPKALSILYRFGNNPDSMRVFVCETGTGQIHTITADEDIPGVSKPVNIKNDRLVIHSIVYGLRQINDQLPYGLIARAVQKDGFIMVNNAVLRVDAHNDPWYGQLKTVAVFYSMGGVFGCASGTENEMVPFIGN
ncbi:unnamed protein product [Fusarium graminearum]|nr:unnamed protein product [Fusarium graminearum]CZS79265.1 unnamed protein product [Fusarium graminearum]